MFVKLYALFLVILAAVTTVIIVFTMLGAASSTPARAVEAFVAWLFGHGGTSSAQSGLPNNVDAGLRRCLTPGVTELQPAMTVVPAGTDPALTYGWLLYARAHPTGLATPSTIPNSSPASSQRATATDPFTRFTTFSQAYSRVTAPSARDASTPSSTTARSAPGSPGTDPRLAITVLTRLDPRVQYSVYQPSATAALLELENRHIVTLDDDAHHELATTVAQQCLAPSSTPAATTAQEVPR